MRVHLSPRSLPVFLMVALAGYAATPVLGEPIGSNNWHLNSPLQMRGNADVVCKVRIIGVRDARSAVPSGLDFLSSGLHRWVATAMVISILKGDCPTEIRIEYQYPQDTNRSLGLPICQLFTKLDRDECSLVFLKGSDGVYELGRIQSKARVVPSAIAYDLGDEPLLKLLAEFRAGLKSDDEMVRLQAAEELGYIGDELMKQIRPFGGDNGRSRCLAEALKQARRAIPAACQSEDFVIRSVAIMSSFQLAEPPSLDGTLQILREDPNSFGPAASEAKYGIRDFCVSAVQKRLFETMDATTRRFVKNLDDGSTLRAPGGRPGMYRGVPGFPYAQFYGQALAMDGALKDAETRTCIVNVICSRYEKESVAQMIRFLDDANSHIRQTAVSALNRYINRNFSNGWDRDTFYRHNVFGVTDEKPLEQRQRDYELNEHEYIQYWKDWWREHRSEYGNTPDDHDAVPSLHKEK